MNFVSAFPEALSRKRFSSILVLSPDTPFTDLDRSIPGTCGPAHPRTACILGKGKQVALGKKAERFRMHLRALGAQQGSKGACRLCRHPGVHGLRAALPATAWQGRLGLTMATSFFSSSSSFSFCFFLSLYFPQWWPQASTHGWPAGGREDLESQGGWASIPTEGLGAQALRVEARVQSQCHPRGGGGCRVAGTPGPLCANCWQSPGALCLNFRKGRGLRTQEPTLAV